MGDTDNIDNNSYIIDNAISNMKEIYERSLVTNIVGIIETNDTIITNKDLVELPITDDNKNQYFEEYVNEPLNDIVEDTFGTQYRLEQFQYQL